MTRISRRSRPRSTRWSTRCNGGSTARAASSPTSAMSCDRRSRRCRRRRSWCRRVPRSCPPRSRQAVELLVVEVERLQQLVEDLLELGRADAGVSDLQRERVGLRELVAKTLEANHVASVPSRSKGTVPDAPARPRDERLRRGRQAPARPGADEPGDERGVTRRTGCSGVRIAEATTASSRSPLTTRGPGVRGTDREDVFERFFRGAVGGRRASGSGSGLGLALVAEHVRLHGGRVWVEDSDTGGARFVVELPGVDVKCGRVVGVVLCCVVAHRRAACVDQSEPADDRVGRRPLRPVDAQPESCRSADERAADRCRSTSSGRDGAGARSTDARSSRSPLRRGRCGSCSPVRCRSERDVGSRERARLADRGATRAGAAGVAAASLSSGFRDSAIGNQPAALAEIVYTLTAFPRDQAGQLLRRRRHRHGAETRWLAHHGPVDRKDYVALFDAEG